MRELELFSKKGEKYTVFIDDEAVKLGQIKYGIITKEEIV